MPRAGQNVRSLAFRRRLKAFKNLSGAITLLIVPLMLPIARSLSPIFINITLPAWSYLICIALAILLILQANHLWKRAKHADQGALAEEQIADLLITLKQQGWHVEFGIQHRSVGDIDVFLLSPTGKAFSIDVKSHRGIVRASNQQLYRKRKDSEDPFEKDFLKQAKKQAVAIKELKGLRFVTPIVVFSNAKVDGISNPIAGVHVLEKATLLSYLRSLDQNSSR
jgi:hypothetical protein